MEINNNMFTIRKNKNDIYILIYQSGFRCDFIHDSLNAIDLIDILTDIAIYGFGRGILIDETPYPNVKKDQIMLQMV